MDPEDDSETTEQDIEILEGDAVEVLQLDDEEAMFEGLLRDTIHDNYDWKWGQGVEFCPYNDPFITSYQKSNYCQ